ncbi:MAG: iron ABC transporter permease [Casimicrobiaceae bacterium]|nr:iron ABC transporter permease [Casimicrobiaceae bacterium]
MKSRLLLLAAVAAVALPFLTLVALAVGWTSPGPGGDTLGHYAATVLPGYVANSVVLAIGSVTLALVVGCACAWQIERYQFFGRDVLAWALVLPMAMPAYVAAYALADFTQFSGPLQSTLRAHFGWQRGDYWFPEVTSIPGAIICFGFTLYPYVYLLARSAFAERGRELFDAARSLGLNPRRAWWSAVLPTARPALVGGGTLVLMEVLADFGATSYLGVDTLTVGIYRAWYNMSDLASAARLALALLAVVVIVHGLEQMARSRARYASRRSRLEALERLTGRRAVLRGLLCLLPLVVGFLIPTTLLLRLLTQAEAPVAWMSTLVWTFNSVQVGVTVAAVTAVIALTLRLRERLWHESSAEWLNRILSLGYAVPGAVLALGILIPLARLDNLLIEWSRQLFSVSPGLLLTGSITALVYAISVRLYGIAGNAASAAFARIPRSLDDSARVLGLSPLATLKHVHWPLARGTMLAAALLVFVDTLKELPATLALKPFDFDTLATATYNLARDERLAEAALPSLLIVIVSLPATMLLAGRLRMPGQRWTAE